MIRFSRNRAIDWHVTSGNQLNSQMQPEFAAARATTHQESSGRLSLRRAQIFKGFLQKQAFDVVMTLTGLFGAETLRLAKAAGVPTRVAWHRRSSPAFSSTFFKKLYARWCLHELENVSDWILSNSEAALDRFHGHYWRSQAKYRVIPNGVDPKRFRPRPDFRKEVRDALGVPDSAVVVGHVGRVDPAKDHETLLKTIRMARDGGQNTWLLCAGTGTESDAFRKRLEDMGIAGYSRFLGARSDIERFYPAMDVFLFPSITEGQPNALIEAMLSGVRVLASDIAPIREAMPDFLSRDLFPPGNVQAAYRLLADVNHSDYAKITRARNWAEARYDPQVNFNAVLGILGC